MTALTSVVFGSENRPKINVDLHNLRNIYTYILKTDFLLTFLPKDLSVKELRYSHLYLRGDIVRLFSCKLQGGLIWSVGVDRHYC